MTNVVIGILEGMGVTSRITELRRLRKRESCRTKPRTLMLILSTEHEARLFLAKEFERKHNLNAMIFLSFRLQIKKTQKLVPQKTMSAARTICASRKFEGLQSRALIRRCGGRQWRPAQEKLTMFFWSISNQFIARNLGNFDRRMKFSNAVTFSDDSFVGNCKTLLY